ncbi:MAG TPA: IS200/IS605 family transposase [Terriglobales bacterium]|jgi:putative transposase|nr:IS200/IS605 family transposase [Terriglobales bacterium]
MAHSYICCLVHVVFSTAERRPLIREKIGKRLHAYIGGIARENGFVALAVGGVEDHVHVLLSLSRTVCVSKAVQLLKAGSSKWFNENFSKGGRFSWQEGFGAFSVGISQRSKTIAYINNQAEHHKKMSFVEEFKKFLAAHGIEEANQPSLRD